jgi:hypothetical protein
MPIAGITDIICDSLSFCHEIPIREHVMKSVANCYTIGLECLILSKTQIIRRVARDKMTEDAKVRYLGDIGKGDSLLGMEPKDMRDVTAVFLDHELGDKPGQINIDTIGTILKNDWGLRKTTLLNLTNLVRILSTSSLGLDSTQHQLAKKRIQSVIEVVTEKYVAKPPRFALASEWWETVDEGRA